MAVGIWHLKRPATANVRNNPGYLDPALEGSKILIVEVTFASILDPRATALPAVALIMVAAGAGIGVAGNAPSVSIALVAIGAGMFFIGTMMPTLSEFQVGPTGFSAKLRERDQDFEAVFGPNADQLARIGTWLAGSPQAGKELAERALIETYMRWPEAHADPTDAVRKRMVELAPPAQPAVPDPQQGGAGDLLSRLIALPVAERSALVLHLLEGLSTDTVASITHREPAAVAGDIARGAAGVVAATAPPPPGAVW